MNWLNVINNGELVYASKSEDKSFRTWSLRKITCNISFYETYSLEDIDKVVCTILKNNNGTITEGRLATILGFNIINNFEIFPKRYADIAEYNIFKDIIDPVFKWGLIKKEENNILLTSLGYRALENKQKYRFYSASKKLLVNENISPATAKENLFFHFYSEIGEETTIENKEIVRCFNDDLEKAFNIQETELIQRLNFQLKEKDYIIYQAQETNHFELSSCKVDIRLYQIDKEYFPIIFYNDNVSFEATNLLNSIENVREKEKKIEWGLYLKLINEPTSILNYENIILFEDILDLDFLIKDSRTDWNDTKLFSFISEQANANQWSNISRYCPINILKQYLQQYCSDLDWTTITMRIDDIFLIENITLYPWNFEIISEKGNLNIESIKKLLLIPDLKKQEWNWEKLMPLLDFSFIQPNIDKVDFDLYDFTRNNIKESEDLIVQYPNKKWDWQFISLEYDLCFILTHICIFKDYLNLEKILNRAFSSDKYVDLFCHSSDFYEVLINKKDSLRHYSANQMEYVWTYNLIDLLQKTGFLSWESSKYTLGFECNEYVEWTYDYFNQNYKNITTEKGYSFVSNKVKDSRLIVDFPNFFWDWEAIANNSAIEKNRDFILKVVNENNLSLFLPIIDEKTTESLFSEKDLLSFLDNNPQEWKEVTEKVSIDFVRKNISYQWDWSVLTRRFCSFIKIEALGNLKWINKWDWNYLTQHLDIKVLLDNLDLYVSYWDWEYLSRKVDTSYILKHISEYSNKWIWDIILDRIDNCDLSFSSHLEKIASCISMFEIKEREMLWKKITHKFSYKELKELIEITSKHEKSEIFQWDYMYFYNLPEFNVRQYLEEYTLFVKWDVLSQSNSLNNTLKWDKALLKREVWLKDILKLLKRKEFLWNFKALSRLESINFDIQILKINTYSWDWDYLSEYSSCFRGTDFEKRFDIFSTYINFNSFSKRKDTHITENLISKYIDKNWNWELLSENETVEISIKFIKENNNKKWNWDAISKRSDIEIDNTILFELSDKEWNWEILSNRKGLIYSEEFINKLHNKPFNWFIVSEQESFIPNANVLSLLKGETLNWDAISQNEKLNIDILWDYQKKLNWGLVTKNKIFDISNIELLTKFQEFLDWDFISQSDKFDFSINTLSKFRNKLQWNKIYRNPKFKISEKFLETFTELIDWSIVSQSTELHFTEALIEKYKDKWDWQNLSKNIYVKNCIGNISEKYNAQFNIVTFLEQLENVGETPCIYHFTHLFNAIDIIKKRKILSRNEATGEFSNAAGKLIDRRKTAYDYARFYFRPQTPTQFYNECLGKDHGDDYYQQALKLGLPKCPMPVFFVFNLKEVLMKIPQKCFYSTGNMQTNWAQVEKIIDNPNKLNTECLYYDAKDVIKYAKENAIGYDSIDFNKHITEFYSKYKTYSQQEFLIENEFDFSILQSFEIICYNKEQAELLKSFLGDDIICEKISSSDSGQVFHKKNRQIFMKESNKELLFSSNYNNNAYLSIRGEGIKNIEILNPKDIQKETIDEIIIYPEIKIIKTIEPIEIYFVDNTLEKREWLIYKN